MSNEEFDLTISSQQNNKSLALREMILTANSLKNVGSNVENVDINNHWDGNLYSYTWRH
jgi:hypothetical protein